MARFFIDNSYMSREGRGGGGGPGEGFFTGIHFILIKISLFKTLAAKFADQSRVTVHSFSQNILIHKFSWNLFTNISFLPSLGGRVFHLWLFANLCQPLKHGTSHTTIM